MIIYFILLLLWCLLANYFSPKTGVLDDNPKNKWKFCLYSALLMSLVMGLRAVTVGSDTPEYLDRYESALGLLTSEYVATEPGYNILNFISHDFLGLSYTTFLLLTSLFFCLVLARFIYHFSTDSLFSFFIHLTIGSFAMSMSGIRQCLAISFCYMALIFLYRSNYKLKRLLAIALVLLAYTFHNSAFFFLPFVLIPKIRLSKTVLLGIGLLSLLVFVFNDAIGSFILNYVPTRYSEFSLNTKYHANIWVYPVPASILLFSFFCIRPDNKGKYSEEMSLWFLFLIMNLVFFAFISLNNQIGRLSYYFINAYMITIPLAINTIRVRNNIQLKWVVIFFCLLFFIMGNYGGVFAIDEYKFFWQAATH